MSTDSPAASRQVKPTMAAAVLGRRGLRAVIKIVSGVMPQNRPECGGPDRGDQEHGGLDTERASLFAVCAVVSLFQQPAKAC